LVGVAEQAEEADCQSAAQQIANLRYEKRQPVRAAFLIGSGD
jgi:hypothetical protein